MLTQTTTTPATPNSTGALSRAHVAGLLHHAYGHNGLPPPTTPNPAEQHETAASFPLAALAACVPATLQRLFPPSPSSSSGPAAATVDWPAFVDRVGGGGREAEEARDVLLGWIVT